VTEKTYPIGVALSAASHKLLCEFPDLHEAVTDLAGWSVMTHHMASQDLMDAVAAKVIGQVPWMPGAIENMPTWSDLPRDEVKDAIEAWLTGIRTAHGDTVTLDLGEPLPYMSPFAGFESLEATR
jgi:hypothetical protein